MLEQQFALIVPTAIMLLALRIQPVQRVLPENTKMLADKLPALIVR